MSKVNNLVKQVELFEKLAVYGNRTSFLKSLSQDVGGNPTPTDAFSNREIENANNMINPPTSGIPPVPPAAPAAPAAASVMQMPADHITGYRPIDKGTQQLLSQFLVDHGAGIPLSKIDGVKGPDTLQALKNFKNYLRQPNMSDEEVASILNMPGKVNQMVASMKATPSAVQPALNRATPPQAPQQSPQQVASRK